MKSTYRAYPHATRCVAGGKVDFIHPTVSSNSRSESGCQRQLVLKVPKGDRSVTYENPHIGSTFQNFLQEEGIAEEVDAAAIKRVLAWQIEEAMKQRGVSEKQR